ncbi:hypothetical protein [Deinococcus misasensis]|uniref:hypothetical protein n=1 Tax=Deinococcus misasensis TaxID=392413 RepID=UPI0005581520|nr:hypothetical protein [Deinococcus misasensis]
MSTSRNTFAFLTALALGSTAFAATTGDIGLSVENNMSDVLTVSGSVSVVFTGLGNGTVTGSPTLAYETSDESILGARKITVALSAALPDGVTGTVNYTPDSGNGTGAEAALGTSAVNLVTGIPRFSVQSAKALTYAFAATKGFDSNTALTVTYTLIAE